MIKLVRVDHRLLHGQVIFSWTKQKSVNHIIVLDDEVPNQPITVMALSMAKPADCGLDIIGFNDLEEALSKVENKNVMILIKGPVEALQLINKVPEITEINYGGVAKKNSSKAYGKAVYLTPEELLATQNILNKGVSIYVQQVPSSSVENVDFK